MDRSGKLLIFLGSIFLSIVIIFSPLAYYIFNPDHYQYLYEKNNVFDSLNREDVMKMTDKVLDFFKSTGSLDGEVRFADPAISNTAFFTPAELSHMEDVRVLLRIIFIIFYSNILFIFLTFIMMIEKDYLRFLRKAGLVFIFSSLFIMILFSLLYLLSNNFSFLFARFHLLFFPQGNYTFPAESLLIGMFPLGFFYDYFTSLIKGSAVLITILVISGIIFIVTARIRKKND